MIFYFTGTGNSLWVAKEMQTELGGELIDICKAKSEYTLSPNESLGFVFPVYYWGLPDRVALFLKSLKINNSHRKKTFIAVTCGITTGTTCEKAEKILQEHGVQIGYKTAFKMIDNYAPIYKMPDSETAIKKLEKTKIEIRHFTNQLKNSNIGNYNHATGPLPGLVSPIMRLGFVRSTKRFTINEQCTGCGLCSSICPAEAIQMKNGKPVWEKKTCEKCLGCLHRCPAGAINYGRATMNHGRYTNPFVEL